MPVKKVNQWAKKVLESWENQHVARENVEDRYHENSLSEDNKQSQHEKKIFNQLFSFLSPIAIYVMLRRVHSCIFCGM